MVQAPKTSKSVEHFPVFYESLSTSTSSRSVALDAYKGKGNNDKLASLAGPKLLVKIEPKRAKLDM
jgi:hypothetical protein